MLLLVKREKKKLSAQLLWLLTESPIDLVFCCCRRCIHFKRWMIKKNHRTTPHVLELVTMDARSFKDFIFSNKNFFFSFFFVKRWKKCRVMMIVYIERKKFWKKSLSTSIYYPTPVRCEMWGAKRRRHVLTEKNSLIFCYCLPAEKSSRYSIFNLHMYTFFKIVNQFFFSSSPLDCKMRRMVCRI